MELKYVIHDSYGGFSLTKEIISLMEEKGYKFEEYNKFENNIYVYFDYMNEFEFRLNPILIEVIIFIKNKYELLHKEMLKSYEQNKISYEEYRYWCLNSGCKLYNNLKIIETELKIVDYKDGIEKLICS